MINSNQRSGYVVTIDGVDFTAEFTGAQGNYSSIDIPVNGLCLITGNIQLTYDENTTQDFDCRFNNFWSRGKKITITNEGRKIPVLGETYIINVSYDMKSSLDITVGCKLALNNRTTAGNQGICIEFGAESSVGDVALEMLYGLGFTRENDIDASGFFEINNNKLIEPLVLPESQTIIQTVANLVAQYGRVLMQRADGQIICRDIVSDSEYLSVNDISQTQDYARSGMPEQVFRKIDFFYQKAEPFDPISGVSNSIRSGDIIVNTNYQRDKDARTTTSTIEEYRDLGGGNQTLVNKITETATYESQPTTATVVQRNGQVIEIAKCFPDDQARILTKTTVIDSDNTEYLKAYFAYQNTADIPNSKSISGTITSNRTTETYTYSPTLITKTTEVTEPIAIAVPIVGDLTLGRSGGNQITQIDPETFIVSDLIIESWAKSQTKGFEATYTRTLYRNRNKVSAEELSARVADVSQNLQSIFDEALELVPLEHEVQFNQSFPQTETFQYRTQINTEPFSFTIGDQTDLGATKQIDLGTYYEPDVAQLRKYAEFITKIYNGRSFGMQVGVWLFDIDQNNWFEFTPGARTKVQEGTFGSVFVVDSPAIVIQGEEAIVSYTGLFIGYVNNNFGTSIFSDVILNPDTLPTI